MDHGNRSAQTRLIARCGPALCALGGAVPDGQQPALGQAGLLCPLASLMLLPPLCVNRPIWALVTALATGILGFFDHRTDSYRALRGLLCALPAGQVCN